MVKFESLELVGFKSFADKLRVEFDERITAVIGPNGCGKSNLFDAIGWVLGAQSARNLRGEKMEDVIFNGTAKRKPSGLAQVTLTVRRPDQTPIVVNGKELVDERLEICRKLYRDGESHYLINQRRCRLKDIHQSLEEAGLGYASYALIAQGKIDAVLTGKPADRRAIIEEAARIANFKSRRRSAEVKLEMAQQNLLRVNDIIQEVDRGLRSLKRQAAKARRYQEIKLEFRALQVQRFALESVRLQEGLSESTRRLKELETVQLALQREFEEREREYRASVRRRDEIERELGESRQKRADLMLELERAENSDQYHKVQIETARKALETNRGEQKTIGEALRRVTEESERFEAERDGLEEEEKRAAAILQEHAQLVERHNAEMRRMEGRLESFRNELLRLSGETASLANLKEQLRQRLQDAWNTRQRLNKDEADAALRLAETQAGLDQHKSAVDQALGRLDELRRKLDDGLRRKLELESQVSDLQAHETECNNQMIAYRERLQSLQEVELNHSQYSEGVRKFLNHLSQNQSIRQAGTLADRIETTPQFERLVEEFLDEELEYVLVDSMDDALIGLSEIKNLKSGRCTFLSINSSNGFGKNDRRLPTPPAAAEDGVFGALSEILQMDSEMESAFRRVLPQRAEAIVVSDLDRAFHLAHSYPENTFITLEGETLTPRGLLSATAADSRKLGLLSLKRQKKQLEKKIANALQTLGELAEEKNAAAARLESENEACEADRRAIHQLEKDVIAARLQLEQGQSEVRRHEQALKVVRQELERLQQEEARLRERIQVVETDLGEKTGKRVETEKTLGEALKSLQRLKEESDRVQSQYHQVAADRKVLQERRQALSRTLERVREQRQGLESRREAALLAATQNEERIVSMGQIREELAKKLVTLHSAREELERLLESGQRTYETWKQTHPEIETRLERLREGKTETQESRAKLEVEKARLETHLQSVSEQCQEQLQAPLEEIVSQADLEGCRLESVIESYNTLRQRLDSFGPVNMTALEEFQESEERFNFLTAQRADIEESIADTQRAIQDLNRRSKEKFQEAFEVVNNRFQEFFQKLFGGGECGMQLLDEDDVLESGIEIYAQPPGKKLQNVMLLSGGEKALTVLALLMGLFAYRPSQYCILDEVDAPLDDANVIRFTNLLREMCDKTQLVLITHNKRTMETSDAIYGVTMAEPGVSQVVSARF